MTRVRLVGIFVLALVGVVAATNLVLPHLRYQGLGPPEYGTWMGVLQVERKVRLLRDFAREGEVDALILSSSTGDHGISGEVLTRELSAARGRPFRAFNFSMGGADLASYPLLYRYARLVARPKQIWVVTPVSLSSLRVRKDSLDEQLLTGPLGRHLERPAILAASFWFHEIALVRYAAAIRDAAVNLKFAHRPVTNLDLYQINLHGDTVSWLYNVSQYESAQKLRVDLRATNLKFVDQSSAAERKRVYDRYFNPRTISALADLKRLAQEDRASITVVPFDLAVGLSMRDREYLDACAPFFDSLSRFLGANVVDVRPSFDVMPYMVSDAMHLNSIGAREFSRLLAARMAGKPDPVRVDYAVSEKILKSEPDPRWTTFTTLVTKHRADPAAALELRYLQNWGIQVMRPDAYVHLAARLADDREFSLPARTLSHGLVLADASRLPLDARDQILTIQVVPYDGKMGTALSLPVASYRWSDEKRPAGYYELKTTAKVVVAAPAFVTFEPVRASWSGIARPTSEDWIGVFPAGKPDAARITFASTKKASSGTAEFSVLTPGRYELRLFLDIWGSVSTTEPFEVVPVSAKVEVASPRVAPGDFLEVSWSGLNYAHKDDWVGLFARGAKTEALESRKTGGLKAGVVRVPVAKSLSPGEYEVRLNSSGGWTSVGTAAVAIVPPAAGGKPAP